MYVVPSTLKSLRCELLNYKYMYTQCTSYITEETTWLRAIVGIYLFNEEDFTADINAHPDNSPHRSVHAWNKHTNKWRHNIRTVVWQKWQLSAGDIHVMYLRACGEFLTDDVYLKLYGRFFFTAKLPVKHKVLSHVWRILTMTWWLMVFKYRPKFIAISMFKLACSIN